MNADKLCTSQIEATGGVLIRESCQGKIVEKGVAGKATLLLRYMRETLWTDAVSLLHTDKCRQAAYRMICKLSRPAHNLSACLMSADCLW